MNTDEILQGLTDAQRVELHASLAAFAVNSTADFKRNPAKFATCHHAVRLKENIYLNVTLTLHLGDKDKVHSVIEEIVQVAAPGPPIKK